MEKVKLIPLSAYQTPKLESPPKEMLDRVREPAGLHSAKQEAVGTFADVWRQCKVPEVDIQKNSTRILTTDNPAEVAHTLFVASQLRPKAT